MSTALAHKHCDDTSLKDEVERHWREIIKHSYRFEQQQAEVSVVHSSAARRLRIIKNCSEVNYECNFVEFTNQLELFQATPSTRSDEVTKLETKVTTHTQARDHNFMWTGAIFPHHLFSFIRFLFLSLIPFAPVSYCILSYCTDSFCPHTRPFLLSHTSNRTMIIR